MMTPRRLALPLLPFALLVLIALAGCSDDPSSTPEDVEECGPGLVYSDVYNHCVNVGEDTAEVEEDIVEIDEDTAPEDVPTDEGVDTAEVEEDTMDPSCDKDHDLVLSIACGGDDCDDNNPFVNPSRPEMCDTVDNDCDGEINELIQCTFYGNTGQDLYQIDPFAKEVSVALPMVIHPDDPFEMQYLVDIDTAPDGTLYGVSANYPEESGVVLYVFDEWTHYWSEVGWDPDPVSPSGLAIDSSGTAVVLAGDSTYMVNLNTGAADLIGPLGGDFFASGDCVFNKSDSLFMTSKADGEPDTLVLVDRATGAGTAVGSIGFSNIFGLTAAWGTLYGMTAAGEVVAIDRATGQGTLVTQFADISWWGAASSPTR